MWWIAAAKWQLARLRISLSALISHVQYVLTSMAKRHKCCGRLDLDVKGCLMPWVSHVNSPMGHSWEAITSLFSWVILIGRIQVVYTHLK